MATISRRHAGKLVLGASAGLLLARRGAWSAESINSVVRGVQIGAQSYSFRDRPLAAAIEGYKTVGLGECELWQGHVEPDERQGWQKIRQWRLTAPLSHFQEVRTQFDNAGVQLYAYNFSFRKEMTDEEIKRGFEMAQALGVKVYTIGVGKQGMAPMPVGRSPFTGEQVYQNEPVDIDEGTLQQIAQMTGGQYYRADNAKRFQQIYAEINKLEKTEEVVNKFTQYRELFPAVVSLGLVLLLVEVTLAHSLLRRLP